MLEKLAAFLAHETESRDISKSSHWVDSLEAIREQYAHGGLQASFSTAEWIEVCSQTATWFEFLCTLCERRAVDRRGLRWILRQKNTVWGEIVRVFHQEKTSDLCHRLTATVRPSVIAEEPRKRQELDALLETTPSLNLTHLFEAFLATRNPRWRARQGAFYTPSAVAVWVVEQVDAVLRQDFCLPWGLADLTPWSDPAAGPLVRILDPAAGAGVFLGAAIDSIYATLMAAGRQQGRRERAMRQAWNKYVPRHLLPRLFGLELSPAACLAAHAEIGQKLAATGYSFCHPANIQVYPADTLACADDGFTSHLPMTVIVGNPPFAALSQNRGAWIEGLLKGQTAAGGATANYFEVDGQPLGERKHWLHDDYVKFLRYAQWRVENAGCGVVGLVTNHGYLDNPTFRGVRRQLMQAFSHIDVIDLHGNRKNRETAPAGQRDENVFPISQGVAISILSRLPKPSPVRVRRADLWGTREKKLRRLREGAQGDLPFVSLTPTPPFYFFASRDETLRAEYEGGWALTDVMPVYVAAPVTARDGLTVAFTREELVERLQAFRDLSIPDDAIRQRCFGASRTSRYPPGDTRGWKLAEARRRLAAIEDWQAPLRTCLYRPFDRRWIYWSEAMIDWPRRAVMRHLETPGNLALIARRQMPSTEPCRYFWVTDEIALDGVIRSDNRGGESLFPLFLQDGRPGQRPASLGHANLDGAFLTALAATGVRHDASLPIRAFHYLYALFYAPSYRTRYAEHLRVDFPRVFVPRERRLLEAMSDLGAAIVRWHLVPGLALAESTARAPSVRPADGGTHVLPQQLGSGKSHGPQATFGPVESSFPKYEGGEVAINAAWRFAPVQESAWEWRVGGHQVCRKWLKDRRGRVLTETEIATYGAMVTAATETQRLADEIERAINQHGGWPDAFCGRTEAP